MRKADEPEDPLDAEPIEGVWRVVSSYRPDPVAAARFWRVILAIGLAIVLRLVFWGPIHH